VEYKQHPCYQASELNFFCLVQFSFYTLEFHYQSCFIGEDLVLLSRIVGRNGAFIAMQLLLLLLLLQFFVEFEVLVDPV